MFQDTEQDNDCACTHALRHLAPHEGPVSRTAVCKVVRNGENFRISVTDVGN